MRQIRHILTISTAAALVILLMGSRYGIVGADTANTPSLSISQLKITSSNGQFITLYNSTNSALDMSKYQLQYFNNYDLAKATSSKLITLSGTVPPHGYFMVNDSALLLCYQLTVDSVSLGLSSTAGLIEILGFNQSSPGAPASPVLQDYVGWSKAASSGAQTLPSSTSAFLQRLPVDSDNNPIVRSPGSGGWQAVQPDGENACRLTTASSSPTPVETGLSELLPPTQPPATIVSLSGQSPDSNQPPSLPASDTGLMAPQVTELLPNPIGTGNDSTDEYIELYNSNDKSFDLSGFALQSGLTSLHKYVFPVGTILPSHSFKAYYSELTDLSLSNTSGQVRLLDPLGNSIAATDPYATAKEGQAWSLAKTKWYWTTEPTPNKANVIKQVSAKKTANSKSKSSKLTGSAKSGSRQTAYGGNTEDAPASAPIHTRTLALIVGLAILYGAYEYRADARNKFYQLRRHFGGRQADRVKVEGRRGN